MLNIKHLKGVRGITNNKKIDIRYLSEIEKELILSWAVSYYEMLLANPDEFPPDIQNDQMQVTRDIVDILVL